MAVRLGCRVCGNVLVHARLCKFLSGSGYSVLQQFIGKAPIPMSKIQVRLQEWKTPTKTLLMFVYCVGKRVS